MELVSRLVSLAQWIHLDFIILVKINANAFLIITMEIKQLSVQFVLENAFVAGTITSIAVLHAMLNN